MSMFCFQCEQTAGGKGCAMSQGVCGKKEDTALRQDALTGALIGLARTAEHHTSDTNAHPRHGGGTVHHHHQRQL